MTKQPSERVVIPTSTAQFRDAFCDASLDAFGTNERVAINPKGRGAAVIELMHRAGQGQKLDERHLCAMLAGNKEAAADALAETAARLAAPIIIPGQRPGKAVALVSVRGIALYDLEFQPFAFSTLNLARTVNQLANDPEIGTIVLEVKSPGGLVTGTSGAADAIFNARQKGKRVVALVNPLAASAAYWIAAQANEVVAMPSADVGSIGVFVLHLDFSQQLQEIGVKPTFISAGKYKTEGNPLEPLSADAQSYIQSEVDAVYRQFVAAVARGRGVDVAKVQADFGQGRTLMAPAAKKVGMVDFVMPIDTAYLRYGLLPTQQQQDGDSRRLRGGMGSWAKPPNEDDAIEVPISGGGPGAGGSHDFRVADPDDVVASEAHAAQDMLAAAANYRVGAQRDLPIKNGMRYDGPGATKRMLDAAGIGTDNPDLAKARKGFLIYDAANAKERGAYHLPFADFVNHALTAIGNGVRNASSRLPQMQGVPDSVRQEAQRVIDGYLKRFRDANAQAASEARPIMLRQDRDDQSDNILVWALEQWPSATMINAEACYHDLGITISGNLFGVYGVTIAEDSVVIEAANGFACYLRADHESGRLFLLADGSEWSPVPPTEAELKEEAARQSAARKRKLALLRA